MARPARRATGPYEDVDALGDPVENAFTGTSETWIADATLKWTRPGDTRRRSLKLQGEYMRRTEDGELAFDVSGAGLVGDYRTEQDGWYVQGVYQFQPRWRVGARYDALDSGSPRVGLVTDGVLSPEDFALLAPSSPSRTSLMIDWSPSEFSRLRAQFRGTTRAMRPPTSSSSCSTSTRWARMAPTSSRGIQPWSTSFARCV